MPAIGTTATSRLAPPARTKYTPAQAPKPQTVAQTVSQTLAAATGGVKKVTHAATAPLTPPKPSAGSLLGGAAIAKVVKAAAAPGRTAAQGAKAAPYTAAEKHLLAQHKQQLAALRTLVAAANKPISGGGMKLMTNLGQAATAHDPLLDHGLMGKAGLAAAFAGPKHHSGGGLLGLGAIDPSAIVSGAEHLGSSVLPTVGHLLGNTAKDAINLPGNTLIGLESLGKAAVNDVHNQLIAPLLGGGSSNPGTPDTFKLLGQAAKQSVLGHLAQGDVKGALKTFEKDPLYGASEFTGLYGAVGRAAGAAARTGALGPELADAAATARAGRSILPDVAPTVQHYSKNLLTKKVQKAVEARPALEQRVRDLKAPTIQRTDAGKLKLRFDETAKELRKRIDEFASTEAARERAKNMETAQAGYDARPASTTHANLVAHAAQGLGGSKAAFLDEIRNNLLPATEHAITNEAKQEHSPVVYAAMKQHAENYRAFLADPNVDAAFDAAKTYRERQAEIDALMSKHKLLDTSAAERRTLLAYAHAQIPGVFYAEKAIPTQGHVASLLADRAVPVAQRALDKHLLGSAKVDTTQRGLLKQLHESELKLTQASAQASSARGFLTSHLPDASLTKSVRDRLARHDAKAQEAAHAFADAKAQLQQHLIDTKTHTDAVTAALKDALLNAKQERANLKPLQGTKLHKETLIDDANGVRKLSNHEIIRHMIQNKVEPPAYVRMTAPLERERAVGFGPARSRGGGRTPAFTGKGVRIGAWRPGYEALQHSQISSMARLQRAITHDKFVKEFGLKKPDGGFWDPQSVEHAAKAMGDKTGREFVPMAFAPKSVGAQRLDEIGDLQDVNKATSMTGHAAFEARKTGLASKEHMVLVPKEAHDRYLQHMDIGGKGTPGLALINRQFRNSVLPYSPKWVTGNVVEAGLRSLLVGATPMSARFASNRIKLMREMGLHDEADHLEAMATGGMHYGMSERLNAEAKAGRGAVDTKIRTEARKAADGYNKHVVQRIFAANRRVESAFERGVLGKHMQSQMKEMIATWGTAATTQEEYLKKLAEGYADPRMAADAGRYVHETLGQYDRFSPGMKRFIRSIAPFAPWYLNAAKFVYFTLPLKHPFTQSLLLDVNRPVEEGWVKDHNVPHGNVIGGLSTGDLTSALKVGSQSYLNLGRYTPFGAFTSGPKDYATSMLLPQFSGAIHNMFGQDTFGRALRDPNGKTPTSDARLGLQALNSLLEGFAGPTQTLNRIVQEHGSTPYNTSLPMFGHSELKPGTHHGYFPGIAGGAVRVLDPFLPTYLNKSKKSSSGGKSSKSSSGGKPKSGLGIFGSTGKDAAPTTASLRTSLAGSKAGPHDALPVNPYFGYPEPPFNPSYLNGGTQVPEQQLTPGMIELLQEIAARYAHARTGMVGPDPHLVWRGSSV